jgi:L-alanine-DL-glutamate epimerase-like enolase superfamily enzyme
MAQEPRKKPGPASAVYRVEDERSKAIRKEADLNGQSEHPLRQGHSARIESVVVRTVRIPFDRPLVTASFPIPGIDSVLVELGTSTGQVGTGWIFGFGEKRAHVLRTMVEDLAQLVIGEDVFMVEALWQRMRKAVAFTGTKGIAALGISAIDTACWDAIGRCLEMPIYRLLGASRDAVETYASSGLWLDRDRDELGEEARTLIDSGFRAVKMRMGMADVHEDLARVALVREAIGPDAVLMVDANQAWDEKRANWMANRLAEYGVYWLEEPVPFDDILTMRELRESSPVPLCTGENNYYKEEFRELLLARAADFLMPDLMRMGGVTEFLKTAHLCESFGVSVTPHLFMEVSAHLAAACPNAVWQEHQPWWEPIIAEPIEVRDGAIQLSNAPGFGVNLDAQAVRRFEVLTHSEVR